jgi:hypothetical protein
MRSAPLDHIRRLSWLTVCVAAVCGCTDHHVLDADRLSLLSDDARGDASLHSASPDLQDAYLVRDLDGIPPPYPFLRIMDEGFQVSGLNPGADIDAVSVRKPSGDLYWATKVEDYSPVDDWNLPAETMLIENILGEPQAFGVPFDPRNVGSDKECSLEGYNFLGLGGYGGSVTVSFGPDRYIEEGDVISVYEVGGCTNSSDSAGNEDDFSVQVALAASPDAEWFVVFAFMGAGRGPVGEGEVVFLPRIPLDP